MGSPQNLPGKAPSSDSKALKRPVGRPFGWRGNEETLPKAQRTRGLSSSCQSKFWVISQVQILILITFHLQNLD